MPGPHKEVFRYPNRQYDGASRAACLGGLSNTTDRQTADVPCFLTWNATGAEVFDSHLCRELTEVTKAIRITTDELTVQVKSSGTIKTQRGVEMGLH